MMINWPQQGQNLEYFWSRRQHSRHNDRYRSWKIQARARERDYQNSGRLHQLTTRTLPVIICYVKI